MIEIAFHYLFSCPCVLLFQFFYWSCSTSNLVLFTVSVWVIKIYKTKTYLS